MVRVVIVAGAGVVVFSPTFAKSRGPLSNEKFKGPRAESEKSRLNVTLLCLLLDTLLCFGLKHSLTVKKCPRSQHDSKGGVLAVIYNFGQCHGESTFDDAAINLSFNVTHRLKIKMIKSQNVFIQ